MPAECSNSNELIELLKRAVTVVDELAARQGAPDRFVEHVYPPVVTGDELRTAGEVNPDLLRFDTAVERLPGGGLAAVPYRHRYPREYHRLENLLFQAADRSDPGSFQAYLLAAATYVHTGLPEDYTAMMEAWVTAWDSPICFPLVLDETYADTLFGIKGTPDAALFVENTTLSHLVELPLCTWTEFARTIPVPGSPERFKCMESRVVRTLALGGSLPAMQLRAWNLPNHHGIRTRLGARQLIITETTMDTFLRDILPMCRTVFGMDTGGAVTGMLRDGLFWTLAAHELGHNMGCYTAQTGLQEYNDVFEELKANILPVLWVLHTLRQGLISREEAEAAVAGYLCLDLMDCVLARTVPSRRPYDLATRIQMNTMLTYGGLRLADHRLVVNLDEMEKPNRQLLDQVLRILCSGNRDAAREFALRFDDRDVVDRLLPERDAVVC